jgi:diguanylate cyclase (GGDEF)-like protein
MAATNNKSEHNCRLKGMSKMCLFLEEQGVPIDGRWRPFLLFINTLKHHDYLTKKQKKDLNKLLTETLTKTDYNDKLFDDYIKKFRKIYAADYIKKLHETIDESKKLLQEFKKLSQKRSNNVEELQNTTVECIVGGDNPKDIIKKVRSAFMDVIDEMNRDSEKLDQLSKTDQLTGLGNRRAFDDFLNSSVKKYNESFPVTLMMLDIDFFKKFNDNFGHQIGDQALSTVGKICKFCIEKFSKKFKGVLLPTRYGGEEFAVIMPGLSIDRAGELAEYIRKTLEQYEFIIRNNKGEINHKNITITVSIGVAEVQPHWRDNLAAQLVEAADKALYGAKERGRNQVRRYSVNMTNDNETVIIL